MHLKFNSNLTFNRLTKQRRRSARNRKPQPYVSLPFLGARSPFLTKKMELLVKKIIFRLKNSISLGEATILSPKKMNIFARKIQKERGKMKISLRKKLTLRHEMMFLTRKTIKARGKMIPSRHKINILTRKAMKLRRKTEKLRRKIIFLRVFFIFLRRKFIFPFNERLFKASSCDSGFDLFIDTTGLRR